MDLIFVGEDAAEKSGAVSISSITTPTIARLRNGTATRQPGETTSCNSSGIAYVNVVRSGTVSATSQ